jgi:hypothetical protein
MIAGGICTHYEHPHCCPDTLSKRIGFEVTMTSVDDLVKWCRSKGLKDSREYLKGIREWRQAWRPKRVRVLLVAESHVGQQKGDLKVRVRSPEGASKSLPPSYVRLVYCLGYGEDCLCEPNPKPNHGTWQFWKIFQAIKDCNADAKQPRKNEVMRKWKLLRELQTKGVWLVDASVGALYSTREGRLKIPNYRKSIEESFKKFVWPMIEKDSVEQIWVIGRRVGRALKGLRLEGMPNRITERWVISQPQDHDHERYRKDLKRLIKGISVCQS